MFVNVFSLKYFKINQWVGDHRRTTGDHRFITSFFHKNSKIGIRSQLYLSFM